MIFTEPTTGLVAKYNMAQAQGPITNQANPGVNDLNNMDAVYGISTRAAPYYAFNGSTLLQGPGTFPLTDTFTIVAVVKVYSDPGHSGTILSDSYGGTGNTLSYNHANGKISFSSSQTAVPKISVDSSTSPTMGVMCHVAVTYNKNGGTGNAKIYMNGVLDNTATSTYSPLSGTALIVGQSLVGAVYSAAIYQHEFTPNEVFQDFQSLRWMLPHIKSTWAATPSSNAAITFAKMQNLDNQWTDLGHDIGPVQASQIIATTTSKKKAGADAICDGTADDVEINAALLAVHYIGGGTVQILDGTYNLAAPLIVYDNTTLCGVGRYTIFKTTYGYNENTTGAAIQNYDMDGGNAGIILRDFTISGPSAADPLVYGINLGNCMEFPYLTVSKVHFTGDVYEDIYLNGCYHATIEGCSSSGRPGAGQGSILVYATQCAYCHIVECAALTQNTIQLNNCSDCMIRGCVVSNHAGYGIFLSGSTHCGVIGNTVYPDASGDPAYGIYDNAGTQNLIVANVVHHSTGAAIEIDPGSSTGDTDAGSVVVGNTLMGTSDNTSGYGIGYGAPAGNLNISYNNLVNWGKDGIRASAAPTTTALQGAVVNGNQVSGSQLDGIVLSCTMYCVCAYNTLLANSQATTNTSDNILLYNEGTSNQPTENIIIGNLCYQGSSPPQSRYGIRVYTGCSANMVTMNYLKSGGASGAYSDLGTSTDTTAWMSEGNKVS